MVIQTVSILTVMKDIRHAEVLIVEILLWTIEHANCHSICTSMQRFARHRLRQAYNIYSDCIVRVPNSLCWHLPPPSPTVLAAITQSSVYGAAGLFASGKYTAAVMSGQALAGLFASLARIVSIVAAHQTGMCMSVCPSVRPSVCLSVCPSVCLSVRLYCDF